MLQGLYDLLHLHLQGVEKARNVGFLSWSTPGFGGFNIDEYEHFEQVISYATD